MSYLHCYQLIPIERIREFFSDLFDYHLAKGSVFNFNSYFLNNINLFHDKLKDALLNSKVAHADETPIRVDGKKNYLHCLSTQYFTYLHSSLSRGKKAVTEMGVLDRYRGILVHDCFSMYFSYGKQHAICNAHLVRELTFFEEELGLRWAHKLRVFLEDLNILVKGSTLNIDAKKRLESEYRVLVLEAIRDTPDVDGLQRKRSKQGNLLFRMRKYQYEILRFMWDPDVPFTNNLAERDLRMVKVQQKISGCFRSLSGAQTYAHIRSFISTLKKQSYSVLNGIKLYLEDPERLLRYIFTPI